MPSERRAGSGTVAVRTNEALWERAKRWAIQKMGGKHSARAMQAAVRWYKEHGGAYKGKKSKTNSLSKWTKQKWTTRSGAPSDQTGERYLPLALIKAMPKHLYDQSTRAKRRSKMQYSSQPPAVREWIRRFMHRAARRSMRRQALKRHSKSKSGAKKKK